MTHRMSRQRNAAIVAAIQSGAKPSDVAAQHGLSVGYVSELARKSGVAGAKAIETARRRAIIRELHGLGVTCAEAIRLTGLKYPVLHNHCNAMGLKFAYDMTGWQATITASKARAAKMAALYRSGMTLQQIGDQFGLTRERVRQLMTKHEGMRYDGGGTHMKAVARKQQSAAAKDARYLRKYGCTFQQYVQAREIGRRMRAGGSGAYQTPLRAFVTQKNNAKIRDIPWDLNFWQWWTIWQESGKWNERGRSKDAYVMSRFRDAGSYAPGNVYIGTLSENSSIQPNNPYRKDHPDHALMTQKNSRAARGCSVDGCDKPHYARSYCNNHYYHFVTKPAQAPSQQAAA